MGKNTALGQYCEPIFGLCSKVCILLYNTRHFRGLPDQAKEWITTKTRQVLPSSLDGGTCTGCMLMTLPSRM